MYDSVEAVKRALKSTSNKVGMCQQWTREQFGAPSAGDRDHDGDADAMDGWLSEKPSARHTGDRHPPAGVPVTYSKNGGHGHRAISLGNGMIRSTDAGGSGRVATVPLDWPERHWGMKYVGWSDTIDGQKIPQPPKPLTRGTRVDKLIADLKEAKKHNDGHREAQINAALDALVKIEHIS